MTSVILWKNTAETVENCRIFSGFLSRFGQRDKKVFIIKRKFDIMIP